MGASIAVKSSESVPCADVAMGSCAITSSQVDEQGLATDRSTYRLITHTQESIYENARPDRPDRDMEEPRQVVDALKQSGFKAQTQVEVLDQILQIADAGSFSQGCD
jgi:predicted transcriptional regulator YheO